MKEENYPLAIFPSFEPVMLLLHVKREVSLVFPFIKRVLPLNTTFYLQQKRGARRLKEKKEASRGFLKLASVEPHPYGLGPPGGRDPSF